MSNDTKPEIATTVGDYGRWISERDNGFAGHRCSICKTWVATGKELVCNCSEASVSEATIEPRDFCSCLMPLGSKTCHHCKKPVRPVSEAPPETIYVNEKAAAIPMNGVYTLTQHDGDIVYARVHQPSATVDEAAKRAAEEVHRRWFIDSHKGELETAISEGETEVDVFIHKYHMTSVALAIKAVINKHITAELNAVHQPSVQAADVRSELLLLLQRMSELTLDEEFSGHHQNGFEMFRTQAEAVIKSRLATSPVQADESSDALKVVEFVAYWRGLYAHHQNVEEGDYLACLRALEELLELFPDKWWVSVEPPATWFHQGKVNHGDWEIVLNTANKFEAPTLVEAMAKVREWKEQQ